MTREDLRVLVRGGGDLASGAILRIQRAGWQVLVAELAQPLAVRRSVSFSQAVYDGHCRVEEVEARRVEAPREAEAVNAAGQVPVIIDANGISINWFQPHVLVDARMRKLPPEKGFSGIGLNLGLGPGFIAGENCDAVVETMRGPRLGRVYWLGSAEPDTGQPEPVGLRRGERVLRAPRDGLFQAHVPIGALVREGQLLAEVGGQPIHAAFEGLVRGLLPTGLQIQAGQKVGDLDPRNDPSLCRLVSDKALAVGGGVIEAILTWLARGGQR